MYKAKMHYSILKVMSLVLCCYISLNKLHAMAPQNVDIRGNLSAAMLSLYVQLHRISDGPYLGLNVFMHIIIGLNSIYVLIRWRNKIKL